MHLTDKDGNVYGWNGLEIIGPDGKPKTIVPGPPLGPAGGDLSGTYPNPSVLWNNGLPAYDLYYYPLTNPAGYITSAALAPYLTSTTAAATYYPLTNPAGYITSTALSPYLTIALAASTYYQIPTGTTSQYIRGDGSLATFPTIPSVIPSALTKVDDTNVTLTLGGTPATALLQPVSLTLGWTGTLADSRIASAATWNAKQNAIALTTTGTSGAATLVGSTLNIPQYTANGSAGGDLSGTYPNPTVVWANGQPTYNAVYYPLASNPAGYITSAALAPYLTSATAALTYQPILVNLVFVENLSDLPAPVAGVITLVDQYTYFFTTEVDLLGSRIVAGVNTTILGGSSENCRIKSTGLVGTALITSNYSLPIRNITIEANVALNLQGDGVTTAIDWFGVNFTDCATVGIIRDYTNVIMQDSAFLNSGGLTFNGTIGSIGFSQCLFNCNAGNTIFILAPTAVITRRFRIIYSSLIVLAGETGIDVSALATIPNDGYILTYCNFSGGGTYLANVDSNSNKALFINNIGISNTSNVGHYFMQNNTTATTIGVGNQNVYIKAAGTTTEGVGNSPKWTTLVTNRLTYTGSISTDFVITVVGAIASASQNVTIGVAVAKNGVVQNESAVSLRAGTAATPFTFSLQDLIQVATGDFFEIFVRNETGTNNLTVSDLNVIIQKVTG